MIQTTGAPSGGLELPPLVQTAQGGIRRVGVEIEFARLSAGQAAKALAAELGGTVIQEDHHAFLVRGSRLGDITVELDLRHVHPQRRDAATRLRLGRRSAACLGSILSPVVPCEMVTAPLPVTRLADIDPAIDVLRRAGAVGRGTTLFASLGLHFNVETPSLEAETITAILKAFALLEPWLRRNRLRSIHERLTRFGERYPEAYVRRIVAPDYWPDLEGLADDYLAANPTRRRDLDLLPLLLFLVRKACPHAFLTRRLEPVPPFITGSRMPMSGTKRGASWPTGTTGSRSRLWPSIAIGLTRWAMPIGASKASRRRGPTLWRQPEGR